MVAVVRLIRVRVNQAENLIAVLEGLQSYEGSEIGALLGHRASVNLICKVCLDVSLC